MHMLLLFELLQRASRPMDYKWSVGCDILEGEYRQVTETITNAWLSGEIIVFNEVLLTWQECWALNLYSCCVAHILLAQS